jgi:hypothetical protein
MTLRLIATTVTESEIRCRLADPTPETGDKWVELSIPITVELSLPNPTGGPDIPLGSLATRQLASIQLAVLRYVRDAIGSETQRLAGLSRA